MRPCRLAHPPTRALWPAVLLLLFAGPASGQVELASVRGAVLADCDGSTATLGDRSPAAGARVGLYVGSVRVGEATSDSLGSFQIGLLAPGAYDVVLEPGSGIPLDAIPGSGAISQTRVDSTRIRIVISGGQVSQGNTFLLDERIPVLTGYSPTFLCEGLTGFTMTLEGSCFTSDAVVELDGEPRVTTYVSPTRLRAELRRTDQNYGNHTLQVVNPVAGHSSNVLAYFVQCHADKWIDVWVTSPAGGEEWTGGTTRTIAWYAVEWFDFRAQSWDVDYSITSFGGPWTPVQQGVPRATTSIPWIVPNAPTNKAVVRVTAHDQYNGVWWGMSDGPFTIVQGQVDVAAGGAPALALAPPAPNPASSPVSFRFDVPDPGPARFELVDVSGRRVWQADLSTLGPGSHRLRWNGRDSAGARAAAGVYVARLVTPGGTVTRKFAWMP